MKWIPSLAVVWILATLGPSLTCVAASGEEGVALAIVYDTSGSMKEPFPDKSGKATPKYQIANRALISIAAQLQLFVTNSPAGSERKLQTALYIFQGENASTAINFGRFDAKGLRSFARNFNAPNGKTPLGNALNTASRAVLNSPLNRKHILVITDGINTAGPSPAAILPRIQHEAELNHTAVSVHFVAFDVDAKLFEPLRRLGATVVSASDEIQLNSQLQFILQHKILLEEEEKK